MTAGHRRLYGAESAKQQWHDTMGGRFLPGQSGWSDIGTTLAFAAVRSTVLRVAALVLVIVGVLAGAVMLAPPASAHATVAASDPTDGSRLGKAPAQVSITFDEPVGADLGYLRVISARGLDVGAGAVTHPDGQGRVVAVALKPGLGDGTYIVSWRVTSADSHPIDGTFRFVVGNGALAALPPSSGPVDPASTRIVFDIARTVTYAALALLGGGWLLLSIWPAGRRCPAARRLVSTGWIFCLVGAVAELLLQGPYAAGTGVGGIWRFGLLTDTVGTLYGRLHLARIFLLAGLGVALDIMLWSPSVDHRPASELRPVLRRVWLGPLLFLGVVYTISASGHAGVARPGWLALSSDMAHLTAMSAWLGGLVVLAAALLPRADRTELRAVLPTFSRVAFGCVVVIAATGTYQAWRESGSVVALLITGYGRLVLLKVALFIGLLLAGSVSRSAVQRRFVDTPLMLNGGRTPAAELGAGRDGPGPVDVGVEPVGPRLDLLELPGDLDRETSGQTRGLRRSVLFELILAAIVLAVSGVLVALPPARTAAAIPAASATFVAASGDATLDDRRSVTVSVIPSGHTGTFTVKLTIHGGGVPEQVTATASLPAQQLGPLPIPLRPSGPLAYQAYEVLLPGTGLWTFSVAVRATEFDAVTTTVRINIF